MDQKQMESRIRIIRQEIKTKQDSITRSKANLEFSEKQLEEKQNELRALGIKNVDDPVPEIEALKKKIEQKIEQCEKILEELE